MSLNAVYTMMILKSLLAASSLTKHAYLRHLLVVVNGILKLT